jgi:peptidyl-prolyl cis-trans isomerase A (cyclophilin A)
MAGFLGDLNRGGRAAVGRARWWIAVAMLLVAFSPRGAQGGTLISMNTNQGQILIDLFTDFVPTTTNNFLTYIDTGAYTGTVIHRADTGLGVLQGGGYRWTGANPVHIGTFAPIALEYARANTRGTISMARTQVLNSATSEWFINTDDNTVDLGQGNGGGYAVFGWVVGPGMSVVDQIMGMSKSNSILIGNYPFTPPGPPGPTNSVLNNTVTVISDDHPSFQNPFANIDVNNDSSLTPSDALGVINDLLANGPHNISATFSGSNYLDVNGDGKVTPSDALTVINALLADGPHQLPPLAAPLASPAFAADMLDPQMASPMVVPEPSSWALGVAAALGFAAFVAGCRRRRAARLAG